MTAVSVVLDVIEKEGLQKNALVVGEYLQARLQGELKKYAFVGDVRGMGLFQGIEIVTDRQSKTHDGKRAKAIKMDARRLGVLVSTDGVHDNIIKLKPPLCFSMSDVDRLLVALHKAMENQR
jgi:ethanolamine-phosphate phospho-lyase